jgi:peptidoglycan/LPS O-acetylase OafA/YrhL
LWLWLLVGLTNNYAVVNLAIATALVFLALILAPFKRILSTRPLQFLGKISFGLYLGHFLLIASFSSSLYLLLVEHCSSSTAAVLTTFLTVALSMPVAW